jgi:GTP-binding protein
MDTAMRDDMPLVAIVGRPNVGKSTLFNRLLHRRRAIVHDEPGVTRDRQLADTTLLERRVQLCDTGGFLPGEKEGVFELMRAQAEQAVREAAAVVFVVDAREGVLPGDSEIAAVLRRSKKPVVVAVNKVDAESVLPEAMAFHALGFEVLLPIAAEHGKGVAELLEAVRDALVSVARWPAEPEPEPLDLPPVKGGRVDRIRVCFVGRPNVGKSTLANRILGQQRLITANQPGTTRDAIDVDFAWDGRDLTLVDTAGLRRKRTIEQAVERYAVSQAVHAIERCHLAVLVLDATQTIADQDAKIAGLIEDRGRACVVAVTKWDLVDVSVKSPSTFARALDEAIPFLAHAPKVFVSGASGQRVDALLKTVVATFAAFDRRVGTGALNRFLQAVQQAVPPPMRQGKRLKIYYGAQVGVRPPQFACVVNHPAACAVSWERMLVSRMRAEFDLDGTPVRLSWKQRPARKPRKAKETLPTEVRHLAAADDGFDLDSAPPAGHGADGAGIFDDDFP